MGRFFTYFKFSTVERNGFIALTVIILLLNIALWLYNHTLTSPPLTYKLYNLPSSTHAIAYEPEEVDFSAPYNGSKSLTSKRRDITYFEFDPNTLDLDGWMKLGLSAKQAHVILNYRNKGGRFYKKEDLQKIYSLTKQDYARLSPYIKIGDTKKVDRERIYSKESRPPYEKKIILVNLNQADTSELIQLRGIGSVLAHRIVKFRDGLGGFYQKEQLKEVYGLSEETFNQIMPFINVDESLVKRLNINIIDAPTLAKHPYINKKQAQTIVNFRLEHGPFNSVEDLAKIKSLEPDFLRKIERYLQF